MTTDPVVLKLVDSVMRLAIENRRKPDWDAEDTVRGNLCFMSVRELSVLVSLIEMGDSKVIFSEILRQLYGHVLHEVEPIAA